MNISKSLWIPLYCLAASILIVTILGNLESNSSPGNIPKIIEQNNKLIVQKIADGLDKPSGFDFLSNKDILVIQMDGQVKLIRDYGLKKYPLLNVNVSNYGSGSGLLGISSTSLMNLSYVFLFYTENSSGGNGCIDDKGAPYSPVANRIYRYTWNASGLELENRTLILDLPTASTPIHNGGKLSIGPDGQLYTVIGDLNRDGREQNVANKINTISLEYCHLLYGNKSESGAILRTTLDGLPSKYNPFTENGFENYYAYGIRNSLGLAFDPASQNLWDTENGPEMMDELNLVKPGFNSGWKQIQGRSDDICCPVQGFNLSQNLDNLYAISGSYYSEPKYVWDNSTSVTGLVFMNSSKLGIQFLNDLFVADMGGNIYHFDLDLNRENVISNDSFPSNHLFASRFGPIVDMKVGPDGAFYILTSANTTYFPYLNKSGSLYRIATNTIDLPFIESQSISADHWGLVGTLVVIIAIVVVVKYYGFFLNYWRKARKRIAFFQDH